MASLLSIGFLVFPNDKHWAWSMTHHSFCRAPNQGMSKTARAMTPNHNQVHFAFQSHVTNCRISSGAGPDFNRWWGSQRNTVLCGKFLQLLFSFLPEFGFTKSQMGVTPLRQCWRFNRIEQMQACSEAFRQCVRERETLARRRREIDRHQNFFHGKRS